MTVQCPRCSTQYRVPDARLSDARPVFKCTRCGHVFSRAERPSTRGGGARTGRGEDRNLSFTFEPGERSEPDAAEAVDELEEEPEESLADADDEEEEAEPVRARGSAKEADRRSRARGPSEPGRDPAFVADLPRARPAAAPTRKPPPPPEPEEEDEEEDDAPLLVRQRDRARREPVEPRRRSGPPGVKRSPLKPIAIAVGAVVAVFLVLALVFNRRPDIAFEQLGAVPLLGRLLGDDHLLVWRLQIGGVESSMDQIRGDRPALVVSGQVLNTSNESLRLIEIEGRLLQGDVEKRRQVVYAANQFRKTIRDLSASEVEMLLRLEPNRRFVVRPGESASFLLVFPDPPVNATEVSCRVLDARPA